MLGWERNAEKVMARKLTGGSLVRQWPMTGRATCHLSKNIRNVYDSYIYQDRNPVGIVKISDQLHEQIRVASDAMDRSINAQAEFWIKIGLLAELNPHLAYNDLINKLLLNKSDLIRGRSA
jgi:hypothetical protein